MCRNDNIVYLFYFKSVKWIHLWNLIFNVCTGHELRHYNIFCRFSQMVVSETTHKTSCKTVPIILQESPVPLIINYAIWHQVKASNYSASAVIHNCFCHNRMLICCSTNLGNPKHTIHVMFDLPNYKYTILLIRNLANCGNAKWDIIYHQYIEEQSVCHLLRG